MLEHAGAAGAFHALESSIPPSVPKGVPALVKVWNASAILDIDTFDDQLWLRIYTQAQLSIQTSSNQRNLTGHIFLRVGSQLN
jgi:hypothetical protein